MISRLTPFVLLFFLVTFRTTGQDYNTNIRLNQEGFLPQAEKIAAINNTALTSFSIVRSGSQQVLYTGNLSDEAYWSNAEENIKIADFSDFTRQGEFQIKLGSTVSYPFTIGNQVMLNISKLTLKAFYYNRASTDLPEQYAGEFTRLGGHFDMDVVIHPSAESDDRPAGTIISSPYGWYDAGDYNKYIVNSGISTHTLLSAYETYPDYYDTLTLNIPEAEDDIPDILNETYWNLRWVATMQDPSDGGVYHKISTANFQGTIMPHQATSTRYAVGKGTAATLDFAAMMAMAARIYGAYDPEFASSCLDKAIYAWQWANDNPNIAFNNPASQDGYPSVNTGEYGDNSFSDEFFWAAAELFITTKEESYYNTLDFNLDFWVPGWPNVSTLGIQSLVIHREQLPEFADTVLIKSKLLNITSSLSSFKQSNSVYKIPNDEFYWGSNSVPGNQGVLLMQAYQITGDKDYYDAALSALDYLIGRNATGYCFVTGLGSNSPLHIHHRQSEADNVVAPVPGFLAGGPNPHNTNDCGESKYPSLLPAKCYVDDYCSYSTNEITINWNAPLVFLSGALDYIYQKDFYQEDTNPPILYTADAENLIVSPNPASEIIRVHINGPLESCHLISLDGKVIIHGRDKTLDVSQVENGVYLIQVVNNGHYLIERIVINR